MRIDYSALWNDVVGLARANASILFGVAGALVFLPLLGASFFTVPFAPAPSSAPVAQQLAAYQDFYGANWRLQAALLGVTTLAQLVLLLVLLDRRRPPVGEAFRLAVPLFVPLLLTTLLVRLMVAGGALLIVPALYLLGRVLLAGTALVAEEKHNPLTAMRRSFALTSGQGWRIAFFVILIFLVTFVIGRAVDGTLGSVLQLLTRSGDRWGPASLLLASVGAAFETAQFLLGLLVAVALYRRLRAPAPGSAT